MPPTSESKPGRRLIGIGNEFRCDDAAGLVIARRLAELLLPNLDVVQHLGDGAALMDLWPGVTEVIVVDAVRSGAPPGTVFRIDAIKETIPTEFFSYSTHAFSLAEAIEVSRRLDQLPPRLFIYGIEGADFSAGQNLSREVSAAIETLVEELSRRLSVG